jgi:4-hydroxy-3-methylbut-2-enyl diphosphate reductase
MFIEIDKNSGFCFGVINAIKEAEKALSKQGKLYCLGDIVHNNFEMSRLRNLGLIPINHEIYFTLNNCTVLLRAHGEPPSTYKYAGENNINIIDATCPVVLKLQKRILKKFNKASPETQFVIYGKKGHAEVNGLVGQTDDNAIVIEQLTDLDKIDFSKPIKLYSQTTKDIEGFQQIEVEIKSRAENPNIEIHDTICRQVANRIPKVHNFSKKFQLILFVSSSKSSNGKMLYKICKEANPKSRIVSSADEIEPEWLIDINSVGICGATSTPLSLMKQVAERVSELSE